MVFFGSDVAQLLVERNAFFAPVCNVVDADTELEHL